MQKREKCASKHGVTEITVYQETCTNTSSLTISLKNMRYTSIQELSEHRNRGLLIVIRDSAARSLHASTKPDAGTHPSNYSQG